MSGKQRESAVDNLEITRCNLGGGWFITPNILTKVEYVTQQYLEYAWTGHFAGAEFSKVNLEAVIGF